MELEIGMRLPERLIHSFHCMLHVRAVPGESKGAGSPRCRRRRSPSVQESPLRSLPHYLALKSVVPNLRTSFCVKAPTKPRRRKARQVYTKIFSFYSIIERNEWL